MISPETGSRDKENMKKPKVLAFIVTFNGKRWIGKCLSSLLASTLKPDVIIIDNGSEDDTVGIAKKTMPEARIIETGKNLGIGAANNLGMEEGLKGNYDYIYLLNQDAYVTPDMLEILTGTAARHPEYGILSPMQMNGEATRLDRDFMKSIPAEMMDDLVCGRTLRDIYEAKERIPAAHWLLPAQHLRKTGLFSPVFPHYGEDDNLTHRMTYHNLKSGIVAAAKGYHDREERPVPVDKLMHMAEMTWRYILANPNLDGKARRKELLKSLAIFLPKSPAKGLRHLGNVIRARKKISRLRQASMTTGDKS